MNVEKKIGGFSLFTLWFGASVSLAEIMTGSFIAPLGIKKGIIVILLGHLIGTFILATIGIIGFREKSPSLISSRLSLGRYGSYIISVFNIIQLIGWTAIMLIQCTRSVQSITSKLFSLDNFTLIVVITGILVGIWTLSTDKGINIVNSIAVILLLILCFVMLGSILKGGEIRQVTDTISFGAALELSIIMPLSWVPLISDYTMSGKSAKGSFLGSFGGYFIGSSFMYIIGLVSSIYTGSPDPIGVLSNLNMGYAALLIVILSTVTTTFLDVYSSVMSTLNLSQNLSRKKLIVLYVVLGTMLAIIFPMEQYENFLYMIGSLFAPVFSVIIADYFIYREDRSNNLFNLPGLAASVVGIITYYTVIKLDLITGSTVPSMIITMFVYIVIRQIIKAVSSNRISV